MCFEFFFQATSEADAFTPPNTARNLKCYRETVPKKLEDFPVLVETMPRLTTLPGHTPDGVNASAIFVAPNAAKVVDDMSTDSMLASYQLRGNAGE